MGIPSTARAWEFIGLNFLKKPRGRLFFSLRYLVTILVFACVLIVLIKLPSSFYKSKATPSVSELPLFSLADDVDPDSYKITARENLDRKNVHRVFCRVQVLQLSTQADLMAIAQKIVRDLILREQCHSVSLDFGTYGHADFAPNGIWNRAGEMPINNYQGYRFKYMLKAGGT